jgi:hypothetical protein
MLQSSRLRYIHIYYLGLSLQNSNDTPEKYISIFVIGSFESSSGCQNNVPISAIVPEGEQHFHPPFRRTLFGSSDILGRMEMKLPIGLKGRELFTSLLDWNVPWSSLGRLQ